MSEIPSVSIVDMIIPDCVIDDVPIRVDEMGREIIDAPYYASLLMFLRVFTAMGKPKSSIKELSEFMDVPWVSVVKAIYNMFFEAYIRESKFGDTYYYSLTQPGMRIAERMLNLQGKDLYRHKIDLVCTKRG